MPRLSLDRLRGYRAGLRRRVAAATRVAPAPLGLSECLNPVFPIPHAVHVRVRAREPNEHPKPLAIRTYFLPLPVAVPLRHVPKIKLFGGGMRCPAGTDHPRHEGLVQHSVSDHGMTILSS